MKTNIFKTRKILTYLTILLSMYFIGLFSGCMESVIPPDENLSKLSVSSVLVIDSTNVMPLSGVKISVYNNQTGLKDLITTGYTNASGVVEFVLPIARIGTPLIVKATYNNYSQLKSVTMCDFLRVDFRFDTTFVEPITCGNLNRLDSVIFVNNSGSRYLYQNTPIGEGYYYRSISLVNDQGGDIIEAILPALSVPFSYKSIFLGNEILKAEPQTVQITPGNRLDILIAVSTSNLGIFNSPLLIPLKCINTGNTGTYTFHLNATVIEPECDCSDYPQFNVLISKPVPVGQSATTSDYVFTNELPCDVTLIKNIFDGNDGWEILSPTFPLILKKGDKLLIESKFTPKKAGKNSDTLKLFVTPTGKTKNCNFQVIFSGDGCTGGCPLFSKDGISFKEFSNKAIFDTLSNRSDNYVKISITDLNLNLVSTVTKSYYILNPDSSCFDANVNITVIYPDKYSQKYYNVSPTSFNLSPNDRGIFDVKFTAPNLDEFQKIVKERSSGRQQVKSDSAFSIKIQISSGSCKQEINVTAVINALPDISPIINLRAFDQKTTLKPEPENEVYTFGNNARTILQDQNGGNAPYPPESGQIWIDVANNNAGAAPPQNPMLKVVNNSGLEMKLWKSNYAESDFSNVMKIYNEFITDPLNKSRYSANPINNINVRDVIAIKINSLTYALIYIRRVDNGTETTSSKQSGIEFRSIYPIYLP